MYGVVLWSSPARKIAVIWCEDHGDLAFYVGTDNTERVAFDAGDLVFFNMTVEKHRGYAHNPRLVSDGPYDGIDGCLTSDTPELKSTPSCARLSANIVPFDVTRLQQKQRAGQMLYVAVPV